MILFVSNFFPVCKFHLFRFHSMLTLPFRAAPHNGNFCDSVPKHRSYYYYYKVCNINRKIRYRKERQGRHDDMTRKLGFGCTSMRNYEKKKIRAKFLFPNLQKNGELLTSSTPTQFEGVVGYFVGLLVLGSTCYVGVLYQQQ